jgi:cysteine protease ATG4
MTQPDLTHDNELPQPQNSNHISTAPLRDKLLTNSSYLAAEIPLKLGHFMSNLWVSGTELSSSFFLQHTNVCCKEQDDSICLLGCIYETKPLGQVQQAILDAQKDEMFRPGYQEQTVEQQQQPNQVWPPDFYEDFISRLWMTYRHNYPPIRPSSHKTDIGWGCMLRSGQSLLANTLLVHFLTRGKWLEKDELNQKVDFFFVIDWRRQTQSQADKKQYKKVSSKKQYDSISPNYPFK